MREISNFLLTWTVALVALSAGAVDAGAEEGGLTADQIEADRYRACMALIDTAPQAAFDDAVEWRGLGGGPPAAHCAASALLTLGQHAAAAERLEELGQMPSIEGPVKVGLFQQAAQGWLLAGEPERAFAVLTGAIGLEPTDDGLWVDRAAVQAEMTMYDDAIGDLSRALTLAPGNADAWAFRGSAYRLLERYGDAIHDLSEAIRIAPGHVEAHLERGNARRLSGDDDGARRDWLRVIELAPDSVAAVSARANIERMDIRPENDG